MFHGKPSRTDTLPPDREHRTGATAGLAVAPVRVAVGEWTTRPREPSDYLAESELNSPASGLLPEEPVPPPGVVG